MEVLAPLAVPSDKTNFDTSFWRIQSYGCVDSTNRIIKDALAQGSGEGLCAVALKQSGGYGRQGRLWESPLGGLYTSFALTPSYHGVSFDKLPLVSLVMSIALRRALSKWCDASKLAIKWPNDLLFDGGKIAGISLEAISGGVCVGIGINVFASQDAASKSIGKYSLSYLGNELIFLSSEEKDITVEEKGRTGIFAEGKEPTGNFIETQSSETAEDDLTSIQRKVLTQILFDMLHEVQHCYLKWCTEGFEPFKDEYRSHMAFRGTRATLEALDGTVFAQGTIAGIDDQGQLLLETAPGKLVAAQSGEVHVRSLER